MRNRFEQTEIHPRNSKDFAANLMRGVDVGMANNAEFHIQNEDFPALPGATLDAVDPAALVSLQGKSSVTQGYGNNNERSYSNLLCAGFLIGMNSNHSKILQ